MRLTKTVRDVIKRPAVFVGPEATLRTASELLRINKIGGLPVYADGIVLGFITHDEIQAYDGTDLVRDVMVTSTPIASPRTTIRDAASLMVNSGFGRLAVVDGTYLVGVVTDSDLLPELGRSFDPLTQLPWTDTLREWSISQLRTGAEITVLFFDIDGFGKFNKRFGHIVGDEVLGAVSTLLRELSRYETDVLCRYGGDEFCMSTTRCPESCSNLVNEFRERLVEIRVSHAPTEEITCQIGQSGGKRHRERDHVHYAATLDNLINLASKDCISQKKLVSQIKASSDQDLDRFGRVRLHHVFVTTSSDRRRITVELGLGNRKQQQLDGATSTSAPHDIPLITGDESIDRAALIQASASATVQALTPILPVNAKFELLEIIQTPLSDGRLLITSVGRIVRGEHFQPVAGSAIVGNSVERAAAASVLAAVNRTISRIKS